MPNNQGQDLRRLARDFLSAYKAAAATSNEEAKRIMRSQHGFSYFRGGIVELRDDVVQSQAMLVKKAAEKLGAKVGNENALEEMTQQQAQEYILQGSNLDDAISSLLRSLEDTENSKCEFLAPNYLIRFREPVRSITVGRVRAVMTTDIAVEIALRDAVNPLHIKPAGEFRANLPASTIEMPIVSWMVNVDAVKQNAREEAKWLIDVSSSFLRLHYQSYSELFPRNGDVEPHPYRISNFRHIGVIFQGACASGGGATTSRGYLVDEEMAEITASVAFRDKAELIFSPPKRSLAERVYQGLGWLTRGRQAEDRAERLLFFFTAIEALLSSEDRTAPVQQTIARHAAVLWTDDVASRLALSTEIKKLYELRSAVVHSGRRSVLWDSANLTQYIAEGLFSCVLQWGDLASSHKRFSDELAGASYGASWPPRSGTDSAAAP